MAKGFRVGMPIGYATRLNLPATLNFMYTDQAFISLNNIAIFMTNYEAGLRFTMAPTVMGPATLAVFDDSCGNLIQVYQV